MKMWQLVRFLILILFGFALLGCSGADEPAVNQDTEAHDEQSQVSNGEHDEELAPLSLPALEALGEAEAGPLRVIATTSIIGDVVAQIGGDLIQLTTLMGPGQDPHSYEPSTGDLTEVAEADLIFVNGWQLEEGLLDDLENVAPETPQLPVSAGIEPLPADEEGHEETDGDHRHGTADPHTWMDPHLVKQWATNIATALGAVDPDNRSLYEANAARYGEELEALTAYVEEQLASLPAERRLLVTNHSSLAYFAATFGFEVVGTVIPATSTLAEPSARGLANLVETMAEAGVCTIFADTTANAELASAVTAELDTCDEVQVLSLYTGAVGAPGSGADSYLAMMRSNVDTIVEGLRSQ